MDRERESARKSDTTPDLVRSHLQVGEWIFETGRRSLIKEECSHPLSPKESAVLLYLADAAPDVVSRHDLMDRVWPRVLVADHVLDEVVGRLRRKLGDNARTPRYIETIAKRGYRMMVSPRVLPAAAASTHAGRSVAVLPFEPIDDEPAQRGLAIGLAQELNNVLTRYPELEVLEPTSAASIPSTHRAAYNVKGSIQRVADRLRVRSRLVTADQGRTVWSLQSTVTARNPDIVEMALSVGRNVRLQIVRDQHCQKARSRARNPAAAALTCAAIDMNYRINQQGHFEPSLLRFNAERAVELDDGILEAYQLLPTAYYFQAVYGELAPDDASTLAHWALDRAMEIESDNAFTLWARSFVEALLDWDLEAAERDARRAIARDPLHPNACWFHGTLAQVEKARGNIATALDHYRRAVEMNDSDGRIYAEYAEALFCGGDYRNAIAAARCSRQLRPYALSAFTTARSEIQSLLWMDKPTEAKEVVEWYLEIADFRWKPYALALYPTAATSAIERVAEHPNPMIYPSVLCYLAAGATELAMRNIRRGIEELDPMLCLRIRVDPAFDVLKSRPEWPNVLRDLEMTQKQRRLQHRR